MGSYVQCVLHPPNEPHTHTISTLTNTHTHTYTELVIRQVEHKSEIHSNESHLAEETNVVHLRLQFSFVLQQSLSFRTRHRLCKQGVVLAGTQQLRSQGPVSLHAHRTERATWS